MDLTSLIGLAAIAGLLVGGVLTQQIPAYFLNWHAVVIVIGGSAAAMILNTPWLELKRAISQMSKLWSAPDLDELKTVKALVALSAAVHSQGPAALREADTRIAGGFLAHAAGTAVDYNNPDLVRQILEDEINSSFDRDNESVNFYRTMAILTPMFGLLGTLIGIVGVLKEIANPEAVGRAMAVAMTTAFYGIGIANAFCVPVAGKLRGLAIAELRVRGLILEGVMMMIKGVVPAVVERRLQARL